MDNLRDLIATRIEVLTRCLDCPGYALKTVGTLNEDSIRLARHELRLVLDAMEAQDGDT